MLFRSDQDDVAEEREDDADEAEDDEAERDRSQDEDRVQPSAFARCQLDRGLLRLLGPMLAQSHAVANLVHGRFGLRPKAIRRSLEHPLDLVGMGDELEVALPRRGVVADDSIR